jgi:hypothetical protein
MRAETKLGKITCKKKEKLAEFEGVDSEGDDKESPAGEWEDKEEWDEDELWQEGSFGISMPIWCVSGGCDNPSSTMMRPSGNFCIIPSSSNNDQRKNGFCVPMSRSLLDLMFLPKHLFPRRL